MNNKYVISDMQTTLANQEFPSVTGWNRLEARPRAHHLDRALQAEVRDALWMLTRQWQMGEFNGNDAGSPVKAKLHVSATHLSHYQSAGQQKPELFSNQIPLEAQVEQLTIPFEQFLHVPQGKPIQQDISVDIRLLMGRQWIKLLKTVTKDPQDVEAYIKQYKFEMPDPTLPKDLQTCAHPEVWANMAAVANRCMDGARFYFYLETDSAGTPHRATDHVTLSDAGLKGAIDDLGQKFQTWFQQLFYQPAAPEQDAWLPERLEYQFTISAMDNETQTVFRAEQYAQGRLDWYAFDVAAPGSRSDESKQASRLADTRSFIPTQIVFDGSPNTRWWSLEDHRTNFGDIKPDTTDIAKLLLLEFGLVYSNDWFLVPYSLPVGVTANIEGLAITNVFGERFWIEPAGSGQEATWQRWSMFDVHPENNSNDEGKAGLLLLPTVSKIQEGRPREQVVFIRDELSNMVWGIEKMIPLPNGESKAGAEAGLETFKFIQQLLEQQIALLRAEEEMLQKNENRTEEEESRLNEIRNRLARTAPPHYRATVRYNLMNSVPEHWIPFIPVHVDQNNREIQLQRAAMPRILEGDLESPRKIRPLTSLLRQGLDQEKVEAYFIHEEEVPRAGIQVTQAFQRTRWQDGSVWVWLGAQKQVGRGEGSSGLVFDQLIPVTKTESLP